MLGVERIEVLLEPTQIATHFLAGAQQSTDPLTD
jgi:hypothetical protein